MLCPKWAAECQRYFGDSNDTTDVFQDYESLVEFLISSGHLSPPPKGKNIEQYKDNGGPSLGPSRGRKGKVFLGPATFGGPAIVQKY